jgi:hypothetical protein
MKGRGAAARSARIAELTRREAGTRAAEAAATTGAAARTASEVGARATRRPRATAIVATAAGATRAARTIGRVARVAFRARHHPAGAAGRHRAAEAATPIATGTVVDEAAATATEATRTASAAGATGTTAATRTTGTTAATRTTGTTAAATGATRTTAAATGATRTAAAGATGAAATEAATTTTAEATTATGAARTTATAARTIAPATTTAAIVTPIVAARGRTRQHVHGVVEVAALLDPFDGLFALEHANETHALRALAHDRKRLHQAREAITREVQRRGDGIGHRPGASRRLGGRLRRRSLDRGGFARGGFARSLATLTRALGRFRVTTARVTLGSRFDCLGGCRAGVLAVGATLGGRRIGRPLGDLGCLGDRGVAHRLGRGRVLLQGRAHGALDVGGLSEQGSRELGDCFHDPPRGSAGCGWTAVTREAPLLIGCGKGPRKIGRARWRFPGFFQVLS